MRPASFQPSYPAQPLAELFFSVSDLLLSFSNGRTLQVIVGSAGYENWHVYGPDNSHTFAIGGGELCREVR